MNKLAFTVARRSDFGTRRVPGLEEGDTVPLERVGHLLRPLFEPTASRGRHDRYRSTSRASAP